jgi:hypothetical protein
MSILDRIKGMVASIVPGEPNRNSGRVSSNQGNPANGIPQSVLNAIGEKESVGSDGASAVTDSKSDILSLLGVQENYSIPDEYMLPEDFDRVTFDMTRPEGYDTKMVDAFYESTYNTVSYLLDLLKKRNKDVAKMASQIDKMSTDLHNSKLNAEMSDGLTVMTGQPSTAEVELQQAQMEIVKLNDKIKRMTKAGATDQPGNSKYGDLQNQVSILQSKLKKLSLENKRLKLNNSVTTEGDVNEIDDDAALPDLNEDSMPLPDLDSDDSDATEMRAQGYTRKPRNLREAAAADNKIDLEFDFKSDSDSSSSGMPMPDMGDDDDNDGGLPLPSSMDDSYEDIGFPMGDDSGEIDMEAMLSGDDK